MNTRSLGKPRKIIGGLLGLLVLLAVLPAPANAYPRPGATERVSVASDGAEANDGDQTRSAISADGRHVAFYSKASNLVPGDTNGTGDVFVHDRVTGVTERVSVASDGTEANDSNLSWHPAISADGRYVAFETNASNLVPGDTNQCTFGASCFDVFVHDRQTATTERVSVASDGTQGTTHSYYPAISADGRYVAFHSAASHVPGDTSVADVYVHDRVTGTTERVSVASDGTAGNFNSLYPVISADGRHVAFLSNATNLVPEDTNGILGEGEGGSDIFVHDRATGITERVSVASDGTEGNTQSFYPAISADGRHVAFLSNATNLVPADTNAFGADVFVHDRATGATERVSVASDGAEANHNSYDLPAISADGRLVAFRSGASNLVAEDSNGAHDVFVHDRTTGATQRVSVASDGAEADSFSQFPAISAEGRHVAFRSHASNLVPGDTNGGPIGTFDVFVRNLGGYLGVVDAPSVSKVPGGVNVSGRATFSGATLAGATDPDADGTGVGPAGAATVGAELTGAALIYRPEQEDLLLRLDLSSLPPGSAGPAGTNVHLGAGLLGVLYGADLRVGETRYEIRALRAAATSDPPTTTPSAALYRCDPDCTELAPLTGSFGTTGDQVVVSVPLSVLGATEGTELTGLRAFTAAGEAAPGEVATFDEAELPDAIIPQREISLGIAPVATPADQVAFAATADLQGGVFSGRVGAPPGVGNHHVWARVCLGETCEAERVLINFETPGPTPTPTPTPIPTPTPTPSVEDATYYFHSGTGSNNLDQIDGSATFDSTAPTLEDPATAVDAPGLQNVTGIEVVDPVWRGELSDPAKSLTIDFWARTLPDQAIGSVHYTVRVSTGGEYFELAPAIVQEVPAGSGFTRVTHTYTKAVAGTQEVPLALPAGPFTIAVRGTFAVDNAATEIRFDSVDFPSGFSTSGGQTPTPSPTVTPTPDPTPTEGGSRGSYPETPNDPYFGEDATDPIAFDPTQWALRKVRAPQAWQQLRATGFGIRVAVLDTGVDLQHEDLQCAGKLDVGAGSDVVSNDSNPDDEFGHGTHVAGIIGACTNNGTGVAGVAPDATLVPVRVLNAAGTGTDEQLIAGLDKATELGVHVVNMSLGYPPHKTVINDVSAIDAAIGRAREAGIVLVAAAGNDSFPLCEYPALAEDIICVGATDPRDLKSFYSTFPNKTDAEDTPGPGLVAPGGSGAPFCDTYSENVLSTIPLEFDTNGCTDVQGYAGNFGTSMASPHVAGVAALVYDRLGGERSEESAAEVIAAIIDNADDLGAPGYDPVFGWGRVNALTAVQSVEVDPDPTPTPTATPSESPTTDPTESPTDDPSESPTTDPSKSPTDDPTTDPGPTTPEAPSNLTARAASSSRIELAWTDNSSSETGFAIERSLDGNDWAEIATAGRNATMHLDMGLDPDTSYSYRARALNPSGYSPYSNTASATTMREQSQAAGSNHAPAAPSNLRAGPSSPSRIELSWNDNANNEDGFALERSNDSASWQEITSTARNHTSYLDAGLAADTTYHYRVRAYNSAGHSAYSAVTSATTQKPPGGNEPSPTASDPPVGPAAMGTATTSIAASRTKTSFNKGFELSGVVERDDNCTGPLEVEVSRRSHGTDSYESVASTAVNGAGAWGLQVVGRRNASYIAQVKNTDTCQGDPSAPTDVLVKAKIAKLRVPANCRGSVRGKVRPRYEGSEVVLQRRARGRWNKVATDTLNRKSRFVVRAKRCGVHRVVWSQDGAANERVKLRFRL